ncbi:MAG TPA: hypothetical protein VFF49_04785 [Thermodesulfobacteriota bacterium]|nr:hypothetical protein [Thermodesulfobacteriota bacterium]
MSLEQLVEYIKQDSDSRFAEIKQSLHELDQKVDTLLQFKWQIVTGSIVVSTILAILIQLIGLFMSR